MCIETDSQTRRSTGDGRSTKTHLTTAGPRIGCENLQGFSVDLLPWTHRNECGKQLFRPAYCPLAINQPESFASIPAAQRAKALPLKAAAEWFQPREIAESLEIIVRFLWLKSNHQAPRG